jgi:DNA repair protein RecO (recombination protein O)
VLGTTELGEADLIVTLLAENTGRLRGVAPSARKSRKRFGGRLEPLTRVVVTWAQREGRELHRIESLETLRSFATMQADPARQAACAVLAEVTGTVVHEGEADPRTFRLLGALLEALEGGLDPWTAVRYLEYWTLRLHGVLPDLDACASCGTELEARDPHWVAEGSVLCRRCPKPAGAVVLSATEREALASFSKSEPSAVTASRDAVRPDGAVERLLRTALESFVERKLRTYRHLRAATRGEGRPS